MVASRRASRGGPPSFRSDTPQDQDQPQLHHSWGRTPLGHGLTVLFGLNGAGKTALLDCLHAGLIGQPRGLDGRPLPDDADVALLVEADERPLIRVLSLHRPLVEMSVADHRVGMAATASFDQSHELGPRGR